MPNIISHKSTNWFKSHLSASNNHIYATIFLIEQEAKAHQATSKTSHSFSIQFFWEDTILLGKQKSHQLKHADMIFPLQHRNKHLEGGDHQSLSM